MITPQKGKPPPPPTSSPIHAASTWMPAPSSVEEAAGKQVMRNYAGIVSSVILSEECDFYVVSIAKCSCMNWLASKLPNGKQ